MGSITIAGRQIFILNENDRYPEPQQNSPPMFAIREDEEVPYETQGTAVDAAITFDFGSLYK
ncbi:TPA: hypothetical protein ACXJGQ_000070 [Serratia marcescens]